MTVAAWSGFICDADNLPLYRPGAYLVINTVNDKCYVGISYNVGRRMGEHARGDGTAPLLTRAIKKYGVSAFAVHPLLYSTTGTDWLPYLEAELIISYGSLVPFGYNIQAASGAVGPYGPAFGAILRAAFSNPETKKRKGDAVRRRDPELMRKFWESAHTPEARAKNLIAMTAARNTPESKAAASVFFRGLNSDREFIDNRLAAMKITKADPEWKAKFSPVYREAQRKPGVSARKSDTCRKTMSTPEFKAKRSATMTEVHSRPEVKEKHRASVKAANSKPEVKAKIAASKLGRIWITDAITNRCIYPSDGIPDGWHRGKCR